ncbi:MAG: hypothetical protein AB1538_11320, partial [Bacillota bacterium]
MMSFIGLATVGALFAGAGAALTTIPKVVLTLPPFPSSAVTVIVAVPSATGVTTMSVPFTVTV